MVEASSPALLSSAHKPFSFNTVQQGEHLLQKQCRTLTVPLTPVQSLQYCAVTVVAVKQQSLCNNRCLLCQYYDAEAEPSSNFSSGHRSHEWNFCFYMIKFLIVFVDCMCTSCYQEVKLDCHFLVGSRNGSTHCHSRKFNTPALNQLISTPAAQLL